MAGNRDIPRRGQFMVGGDYPADPPAPRARRLDKEEIRRGKFMVLDCSLPTGRESHAADVRLLEQYPEFDGGLEIDRLAPRNDHQPAQPRDQRDSRASGGASRKDKTGKGRQMSGGLAMKMRLELAQLSRRYRFAPGLSCALPLAEPSGCPAWITGIASSPTVDQERMLFRSYSLSFLPWKPPPLLYRHREPAGKIQSIAYDSKGRLIITARVDHPEARRCNGLSVAATIKRYELRDESDPKAYHALILQADLDEISLTPTPCNPDCVITSRIPTVSHDAFFDSVKRAVEKCIEIVEVIEVMQRFDLQVEPPKRAAAPPRVITAVPHRVGPFGALVRQLEERHPTYD
jgi:hypothetical protein